MSLPGDGGAYVLGGAEEGDQIWFNGALWSYLLTGRQTGGRLSVAMQWGARGYGPPLHIHHTEDEAFFVVSGEVTFQVGDGLVSGGPGTFVWGPRDVAHSFRVDSEEARFLSMISPGEAFERFTLEAGRAAAGYELPQEEGPPDMGRMLEVASRVGIDIEIIGPPLAHEA